MASWIIAWFHYYIISILNNTRSYTTVSIQTHTVRPWHMMKLKCDKQMPLLSMLRLNFSYNAVKNIGFGGWVKAAHCTKTSSCVRYTIGAVRCYNQTVLHSYDVKWISILYKDNVNALLSGCFTALYKNMIQTAKVSVGYVLSIYLFYVILFLLFSPGCFKN